MASARILPRTDYLRVPPPKTPEFWDPDRIRHLRGLAATGTATGDWNRRRSGRRALDRLDLRGLPGAGMPWPKDAACVDTATTLAGGQIPLTVPLYFGDMSYGSLAGIPNVALARAADETGTLTGTGEGGLHPDVARCKNITVQWASARFGVTPRTLRQGRAVVIKVGQGAKPGVGGHLPGAKVSEVIRRTRRIPEGRDAISPAPHHDIYSIEDLGQRIAQLKHLTGKPVLVKVAATNYAPFIACGIARMGGDGIILDGAGAGTGASPSVMKDHVGLPVEYATAGVDRMLRGERLRAGFTVVAAGTVSSAYDAARLMALGADCVSIGTASLVAMGCVMVHKCHVGSCPALLTTPAEDEPERALDVDWITRLQVNLVHGWQAELQGILWSLGLRSARDLVGRRDLLEAVGPLDEATAALFGVQAASPNGAEEGGEAWNPRMASWVRGLAGVGGKHAGEALLSSMGSTAPPFAEPAVRLADRLRLDGAQVTRPAIDSYRERVDTHLRLQQGMRLAAPLVLSCPDPAFGAPVAAAAASLGLLADGVPGPVHPAHRDRVLGAGPLRVLRVACTEEVLAGLPVDRSDHDVIVADEDAATDGTRVPLEVFLAEADRRAPLGAPDLIAAAASLRGAGDVAKLVALGASAVSVPGIVATALGGAEPEDPPAVRERLALLSSGLLRELRLLLGAAGCTALPSLHGNRELLRAINVDGATRDRLGVKPAGGG